MAGAGRRVFQPGEVLTASNVMSYLQDQAVQVYAGTAARGSAIGTAVSEGMVSYRKDTHNVEAYNGSAWSALAYATAVPVLSGVGLVPIVAPTVNYSGGTATSNSLGTISFSTSTSISLNNVFTSAYAGYKILLNIPSSSATNLVYLRFRTSGTDQTTALYFTTATKASNGSISFFGSNYNSYSIVNSMSTNFANSGFTELTVYGPASSSLKTHGVIGAQTNDGTIYSGISGTISYDASTAFDGFTIYPSTGNITGTLQVFGFNS